MTLDQVPLNCGAVTFHPLGPGNPGYGDIQPDGRYRLAGPEGADLAPGEYQVTVVSLLRSQQTSRKELPVPGTSSIPSAYAQPQQSGLRYRIEPGANQIDLQLSSQGPAAR